MQDNPRAAAALQAANALLHRLHIHEELTLLPPASNNIVFLGPALVVKLNDRGHSSDLLEEAKVLRLLKGKAPTVELIPQGGPHLSEGWHLIILHREEVLPTPPSETQILLSLAELHTALQLIPPPVPTFKDHINFGITTHNAVKFAPPEKRILDAAYTHFVEPALALQVPMKTIHGDAWLEQALNTPHGIKWLDFEVVCRGPVEWDLAGFTNPDAYPNFDKELWQLLRSAKNWCIASWCRRTSKDEPAMEDTVSWCLTHLQTALDSGQ